MTANSLKATLVLPSLQSTKVPRQPILITEDEGENFFPRFARNDRRYAYVPLYPCLRQRHHSHSSSAPLLRSFRRPWEVIQTFSFTLIFPHTLCLCVYRDTWNPYYVTYAYVDVNQFSG